MNARPEVSPQEFRFFYEQMEKMRPDLWRICYPRIYTEPTCGQYYSPKEPARSLMGVAMKIEANMVGSSEQYEFIAASHLVKYRVPMFWLSHDMALAIRQTVPPGQIPWYSMPMPFPAAVFMLPKGSLVHPTEGDVSWVAYSRFAAGQRANSLLVGGLPYGSTNGGMTFLAYTVTGGHLFHWNLPLDAYGPTISLPDVDNYVRNLRQEEEHTTGLWLFNQPHMSDEDNRLMIEVVHYVFGSILLMNDRPDLVTTGSLRKRVGKGTGQREFWTPNVVGEHYRIKRERVDLGGSHASPRFHWVRGSYKQQAYGQGRELRKQIWVEPYTRGLEK